MFACGRRCVYFLKASNGLIKIGYTNNLNHRLSCIKTSSPLPIELYHFIETERAFAVERYFHNLYRNYRKHGEWFLLNDEHLIQIKNIQLADLLNEISIQSVVQNKSVITARNKPVAIIYKSNRPTKAYAKFLHSTDVANDEKTIRAMPEYESALNMYISGQELNASFLTRKFGMGYALTSKICSMISEIAIRN